MLITSIGRGSHTFEATVVFVTAICDMLPGDRLHFKCPALEKIEYEESEKVQIRGNKRVLVLLLVYLTKLLVAGIIHRHVTLTGE
jgi:hypothetical protein